MNTHSRQIIDRYIAIDAHKYYLVLGGLNHQMEIVLPLRRIHIDRFSQWAQQHLKPSDAVVIESTTNTWALYDIIAPLVGQATVANPYKVKLIAASRVKTDKRDVWSLARLLVADLIPEVWVPSIHVRELRALIAHRRRLSQASTRARNRLQSLLHRYNLLPPVKCPFAHKHRDWWLSLNLSPSEHLRMSHDLDTLAHSKEQLQTVDHELARLTTVDPWASSYLYLVQLPGFGLVVSMTVLAAIGDISRFPSPKHLVGYAGLGSSIHSSGLTHRTGRITKQGRKDLRWVLVQAAWTAIKTNAHWKAQYQRLSKRMHPNKAIVAIARKLLVLVHHVLTKCTADRHAQQEMVAYKLLLWSHQLGKDRREGLTTPQFVRLGLMRLGMGENLTHITKGNTVYRIAPVEDVLPLPQFRSQN